MKFILFTLIILTISSPLFARQVELEISTKWIDGSIIKENSSRIIAKLGEEITLPSTKNMKIRITADDKIGPNQSVYLNNKIFEVKGNKENLLSNPKVIALLGREATIVSEASTGEYLEVTILPVKYSN